MLRLIGIVMSIGLADSVNPSTLAPALYLAAGEHAKVRVLEFTLGVFGASLLGGLIVALGPGELLIHLVPHPRPILGYWLELLAGAVLLVGGMLLWRYRKVLSARELPTLSTTRRRSTVLFGAGIMFVEMPTAFPYFAAIATVVGSARSVTHAVLLLVLYNVCFILPLIAIVLVLWLSPHHARAVLNRAREIVQRNWAPIFALVLTLAGLFVIILGATGVASHAHNGFGHFARKLHHLIT
ncbi:GAP family protein [Conexibacter sp. DBS9H8]|uniref:GAP family protein n=1 Tax=Conexibacter sp. DBS9H8 TaxID=2937801 RepID=UPI00200E0579|nr:GAP family protein [Conexibacter sp. DBS9H8]